MKSLHCERVNRSLVRFGGADQRATRDTDARNPRGDIPVLLGHNLHAQVGCITNQTLLARLNRLDQPFTTEGAAFDDVEAAAIKHQRAGVGEP